jgi:hypothetical protein
MKLKLNYLLIAFIATILSYNIYGKDIAISKSPPSGNNNNTQGGFGNLFFYTPIPLIDSLKVLGKIYYNVQAMPNDDPLNSPFVVFFDEIVGCIKIKFVDGETWELLSIKN